MLCWEVLYRTPQNCSRKYETTSGKKTSPQIWDILHRVHSKFVFKPWFPAFKCSHPHGIGCFTTLSCTRLEKGSYYLTVSKDICLRGDLEGWSLWRHRRGSRSAVDLARGVPARATPNSWRAITFYLPSVERPSETKKDRTINKNT